MTTAPTPVLLLILLTLLGITAFSSGTEVALLSVSRYRIKHRAAAGEWRAGILDRLLHKPDQWLGANLVILALASVAASSIATLLALRIGERWALSLVMSSLTVVMIVFCELAPKIYAAVHNEQVALSSAPIYRGLLWLTYPVLWLANKAAYALLRLFGLRSVSEGTRHLSAEELRMVVTEASPLIPQRHRQMLLSILDLERVTVNDIMISRQDIAAIDLSADWEDVLERVRLTPHAQLPVFEGELDALIGVLDMKRAAQELARGQLSRERLRDLAQAREPYFVPEGTALNQQLTQFQRRRERLAFVVDEYGDIQGLITVEDLLEEIVGEFSTDPTQFAHKDARQESSGAWLVDAGASIRALNRSLGWQLPNVGPKTVNGLLLEQLETIPEPGTAVKIGPYEFEILQTGDSTIRTVRVRIERAAQPPDGKPR
ncbi:MAG TPA: CNNM domain-containing protein [Steroidobacteraceae bacterium]|nr:CNNM domain-containing protein [Steroidobacteraceae bacterium]